MGNRDRLPICRRFKCVIRLRTGKDRYIISSAAVDRVVTRVTRKDVIAGTAVNRVIPGSARYVVIAGTTVENVDRGVTDDRVVTITGCNVLDPNNHIITGGLTTGRLIDQVDIDGYCRSTGIGRSEFGCHRVDDNRLYGKGISLYIGLGINFIIDVGMGHRKPDIECNTWRSRDLNGRRTSRNDRLECEVGQCRELRDKLCANICG